MAGQLSKRQTDMGSNRRDDSSLLSLRQEMDRLFSDFLGDDWGLSRTPSLSPSLDLSETENEFEVRMDLPGYKPEEIDLNLSRDVLTVSGEHSEEKEEKEEGRRYHHIERRRGNFHRTIRLPVPIDESKIDAQFKDGVLAIKLPKAEESKPKKINIKK